MAMNKTHVPAAQKPVLGLLIDDHRATQKLFKDFKSAKDDAKKSAIVEEACTALTIHADIEEQYFYPFLRNANPDKFSSLLDEAKVEHGSLKTLISELQAMQPGDPLYDANFTVLGEYANHHITEEEDEIFPKVIAEELDLRELGEEMQKAKAAAKRG